MKKFCEFIEGRDYREPSSGAWVIKWNSELGNYQTLNPGGEVWKDWPPNMLFSKILDKTLAIAGDEPVENTRGQSLK